MAFLDLPRLTCLWRVLKRVVRYRNTTRPDMADGCPERLSLEFLLWIWNYHRRSRPKILKLLRERQLDIEVIWLRSSWQVERFLAHAKGACSAGPEASLLSFL